MTINKKTVLCNIPMQEPKLTVYPCIDSSISVSQREVRYPINAYLEKNISKDDEIKVVLLITPKGYYEKNIVHFKEEINKINTCGAKIVIEELYLDYTPQKRIYERMMVKILEKIDEKSEIMADITYGYKDLPIIVFAALQIAEKQWNCDIDMIAYGRTEMPDGQVKKSEFEEMSSLYYLNRIYDIRPYSKDVLKELKEDIES